MYKLGLFLLCSLYAACMFLLAQHFPPVSSDEVVRAVIGLHRVQGEIPRYSLYDNIFAPSAYVLRDFLPDNLISFYHLWLGFWSQFDVNGFFFARLSSMVTGLFSILAFYRLGWVIGGNKVAICSAFLVTLNPLFFISSCIARPENFLLFTSAVTLLLIIEMPDRLRWKPLAIGTLGFLQMGIHPNAAVIMSGFFIVYIFSSPKNKRLSTGFSLAAGSVIGLLLVVLYAGPEHLWLGMQTIHSYLLRPPIFSEKIQPIHWLLQNLSVIWNGQTYYLSGYKNFTWPLSFQLWLLGVGILLSISSSRWMWGLLASFILTILLVKAKESLYVINFFPFIIPTAAMAFHVASFQSRRWVKTMGLALIFIGNILFVGFAFNFIKTVKPYEQIVAEMKKIVPSEDLKLAGPSMLWFAWNKENFRDSGALLISHWYTGGKKEIHEWLIPWRPDILVLDHALIAMLNRPETEQKSLQSYFPNKVSHMGDINIHDRDRWEVYQIFW
jgi:4-amino-4-deoxy-L-arabinose transferase-like glycosyltransferase